MAENDNLVDARSDGRTATGPGGIGTGGMRPDNAPPAERRRRGGARFVIFPLLLIVLVGGGFFGYNYMQDQAMYVSTDNALVTGALIQVGSMNSGQVSNVSVDIGQRVAKGQEVATVMLPTAVGMSTAGTPKMGFRGTDDQQVSVVTSVDGVVVARSANPGDTVAAGQSLITVVDPTKLWVQAQIEETKISRVQVGQPVELTVDVLGKQLEGRVVAVNDATSGTFSLLPTSNSSGNFNKVTQLVPVKISVDYGQLPLVLGSSVEVKIRVQN